MDKIIDLKAATDISSKLRSENKIIVVTGGVFDLLHIGHIKLLEESKKQGDILFVLLESDETVRKLKGEGRPINPQSDRAEILAALTFVDYVVKLSEMKTNQDYDDLIFKLKPNIITTTKNDPQGIHNERQAKEINAKVVYVINRIKNKSTTLLAQIIAKNFDK